MSRLTFAALLAVVALTASPSAQTLSAKAQADRKAIQSIRIKVSGCVTRESNGHYRLTNAFLTGDGVPAPVGTGGRAGTGDDLSFENSPSFDLIGGRLGALVGHTIEVVGITSDTRLNNTDAFHLAIGTSDRDRATLMVRSVTTIAATCR
jgi:hypothetical protein